MSKRDIIKEQIQKYYIQLTEGCGKKNCPNLNCASNNGFAKLVSDKAALQAIQLYKNKSTVCLEGKNDEDSSGETIPANIDNNMMMDCTSSSGQITTTDENTLDKDKTVLHSTFQDVDDSEMESERNTEDVQSGSTEIIEEPYRESCFDILQNWSGNVVSDWKVITEAISNLFSDVEALSRFSMLSNEKIEEKTVEEMVIDNNQSVNAKTAIPELSLDLTKIQTLFDKCRQHDVLEDILLQATNEMLHKFKEWPSRKQKSHLNIFIITMKNYSMQSPSALDQTFPFFCGLMANLVVTDRVKLAKYWSNVDASSMQGMVDHLQQLITFKIVMNSEEPVHEVPAIISATQCLSIFYHACLLGGIVNKDFDEEGALASELVQSQYKTSSEAYNFTVIDEISDNLLCDSIGKELGINNFDCLKPLIPLEAFVNEEINRVIEVDKDYANYQTKYGNSANFSFLYYPFILSTESKTVYFLYNSRIRMHREQRRTVVSSLIQGSLMNPYLKLQVRRTHIIDDTLIQLELAAENIRDLKKQLYVEFDGEEGIDEGGVSKEFFQLIIESIFNPENGMFIYNSDVRLFLFNMHSFESHLQYQLVGIVLGLAIYNNCILDIRFPSYVYKKLLGRIATFEDMQQSHPVLYNSLKSMLSHEGSVEDDFMSTFQIQYDDVFGTHLTHDLKEDGANIDVTNENREEFVQLYSDWLLNKSIQVQFNALRGGFDLVVNESPLKHLFSPTELELLIIGSESYDFVELENSTMYDGGFSKSSQTVKDFWLVVHQFTMEEKRKLLEFSTGSDRAPVGGLSKLKMIIARNGPSSDRLPTAHTCFNVILLPDYKNLEKLKERLHKAIIYSKGFGML